VELGGILGFLVFDEKNVRIEGLRVAGIHAVSF
jgi:hypothetical protein